MFSSSFFNDSDGDDPFFNFNGQRNNGNQATRRERPRNKLFPSFGGAFTDMVRQSGQMQSLTRDQMMNGMQMGVAGGNGHSYVQSSVYSYTQGAGGQPEIYEAHHSDRRAPGGIREEKKALRDSRKNLEKMAVGHHIRNRGHVIEKSRDMRTNHMAEHQNLIGLSEGEIEDYDKEWKERTSDWGHMRSVRGDDFRRHAAVHGRPEYQERQAAVGYTPERRTRSSKRH